VKGKLGYMSPEQARGRPVDRRCDVWAAGVVAWELLTGARLLPPGDEMDRLMRLVNQDPPRLRTVRRDLPQALDDALAQALCRDVERRIPTAEALRKMLVDAAPIAGGDEVAALIASVVGPKLEERRRRAREVLRLRGKMNKLLVAGIEAAASSTASPSFTEDAEDTRPDAAPHDGAPAALVREPPAEPRGKRGSLALAGIAAAIALVASGLALGRIASTPAGAPASEPAQATAAAKAPPAEIASASVQPVQPPAPEPPSASASPSASAAAVGATPLLLVGNAAIARVYVDQREIPVDPPARSVALELSPDERDRDLKITAVAVDGRREVVAARGTASSLGVAFRSPRRDAAASKPRPKAAGPAPLLEDSLR
jgi:eukaryotic-like serine/threonine-protein kinase